MTRSMRRVATLCCLAGLLALPALAQEPAPEQAAAAITRLDPQPMAGIQTGRAVVVKGEAGPDGHRFMLDGLSSLMPVTVLLRPVTRGERVAMRLSKYAWNQPLRDGGTEGDVLKFRIRTEAEFQITVTAPEPGTAYRLLVWVGDEVKPTMAPIVVKASEFGRDPGGAGWGGLVLWVVAALLLAIVGLLTVIVLRRRKP